jgi:hypothetical protein
VPLLADQLQEQAYGGLKPSVKRRLRELASSFDHDAGRGTKVIAHSGRIKPGTPGSQCSFPRYVLGSRMRTASSSRNGLSYREYIQRTWLLIPFAF